MSNTEDRDFRAINKSEPKRRERLRTEANGQAEHYVQSTGHSRGGHVPRSSCLYNSGDLSALQGSTMMRASAHLGLTSIDELLERDRLRVQDGFPRKIRVGRLVRPGKGDRNAIVVVPTTVEEKFIHDTVASPQQEGEAGGSGDGKEGEVIGERPVRPESGDGQGAGEGGDGGHDIESNAYDLGKILTEKFELPNLRDKGTRRSLTKYTYDITDKNRGFGQVLDKKATLRQILNTNFALGRIADLSQVDTSELLVSPADRIFRILSPEKEYESQAMVFFVRDYSGSMAGKCTELVVAQHVLIYSWLIYQYAGRVETRYVLHDTDAKEVPDFYTYYNSSVAGGTQVSSAYSLVNKIVEEEGLAREYNIYIFQGTDGDDWDDSGEKAIPELKAMLDYASRVGITIAEHSYTRGEKTEVQRYLENSGLLKERADLLALDVINENADEARLIEGIRNLIAQNAR
ncbi:MAG: DUF444 family protein [Chitinivibrionales bacterium]|nr:DUF444 family protein [Chitinivibrionales bacterium]MBD3356861.1 DUF444 family protein [Chitinivibrionales bacterium]